MVIFSILVKTAVIDNHRLKNLSRNFLKLEQFCFVAKKLIFKVLFYLNFMYKEIIITIIVCILATYLLNCVLVTQL